MISLMIYGVIAIALASAAGYAFVTFTNATKQTTYAQENTIRLEGAVSALRASLMSFNPGANGGVLFAPMGVTASDNAGHTYTQLPASLGAVATTPWGQPYLYCPISQTQTSTLSNGGGDTVAASTVESPSGASYTITTYDGPATSNIAYVISNSSANSVANSTGYVAFIVSSLGPGQTIPDCSAISINGTSISVPNGSVRAVAAGFPWNQRVVASTDRTEIYAVPNSSAPTGDGTGRDANNLTTFDAALNLWQALQPRQTSIYLVPGGGSFTLDSDLDAEDVRSLAQGESTSLLIGTVPTSSTLAAITLSTPLTLTTATSFINVTIAASANATLTTVKPLLFKNVAYSAASAGTGFNVLGTSFFAQNTSFGNILLTATNSTVEFYNWTSVGAASTFSNTEFVGNMSRFGFDAQSSATYTFSGTTSGNPITMTGSTMNIGSGVSMSITNTNDNMYLNNTILNVTGALSLAGGTATAGIDALAGTSISVPGTITTTTSTTSYGIYLRGSKLALDGTLTTPSVKTGAIAISEGEFTGGSQSANIAVPVAVPCLYLLNAIQGATTVANAQSSTNITAKLPVPVYATAAASTAAGFANYPIFTTVQKGYQPMVGDTTNSQPAINTAAANYLYPPADTTINDPWVYNSVATSTLTTTNTDMGYVDPYTLERGVRDLVNLESVTGVLLNYYGGCT